MFNIFKSKKKDAPLGFSREQSLKTIPIHNVGITEKIENGVLKISYFRDSPFTKLTIRLKLPRPEKVIIFDEIGSYVWHLIDGKKNMDQIIEEFRKKYPLSRREAETAIVAHLKNRMTRGAISVIVK